MIAKIIRGNDFRGLLNYLTLARRELGPNNFDLVNLVSLKTAAAEMRTVLAGAKQRSRIANPVMHAILAWGAAENPSVDEQKAAARRFLEILGLSDHHQAVIAVHNEVKNGSIPGPDGRHAEVHICLNRVRFDGSVNKMAFEFQKAEIACAQVAQEMGFALVPGRFNSVGKLTRPGFGNAIGSMRAGDGVMTLVDEILSEPDRLLRLRKARSEGWTSLLAEFEAQGITLVEGPRRGQRQTGGLVMVDAVDPQRKIKISSLDSADEKWGGPHLIKELGPAPVLETIEHKQLDEAFPKTRMSKSSLFPPTAAVKADLSKSNIAETLRADDETMSELRAARSRGWQPLLEEFRRNGIEIHPAESSKNRDQHGLVMVDQTDPSRRQKLSALDSPMEKWGAGALEAELGSFPRTSKPVESARLLASAQLSRRAPANGTGIHRQMSGVWDQFEAAKASAKLKNDRLKKYHAIARRDLQKRHAKQREGTRFRRKIKRIITGILYGSRNPHARTINIHHDVMLRVDLRALGKCDTEDRRMLANQHARERTLIPRWAQFKARAIREEKVRLAFEKQELEQKQRWQREHSKLDIANETSFVANAANTEFHVAEPAFVRPRISTQNPPNAGPSLHLVKGRMDVDPPLFISNVTGIGIAPV